MALWITSIGTKRPGVIPSIFFKYKGYKICFACKSIEPSTDKFVTCSCGDTTANVTAIKDILATKTYKENPLYQKSVACEAMAECQTEGGGGGEAKLQKEVARLKREIEFDKKTVEEAEDTADSLFEVLRFLQDYNLDVMLDTMKLIQKLYPNVYTTQKRNFGSDWDDSLMCQGEREE